MIDVKSAGLPEHGQQARDEEEGTDGNRDFVDTVHDHRKQPGGRKPECPNPVDIGC